MFGIAIVVLTFGMLTGWLGGLTAHAMRGTRWTDPGARLAWWCAAGSGAFIAFLLSVTAVVVGALVLGLPALVGVLVLFAAFGVGGWLGWIASERVAQVSTEEEPPAGDDFDLA